MAIEGDIVSTAMVILVTVLAITNIGFMYWISKKKKK